MPSNCCCKGKTHITFCFFTLFVFFFFCFLFISLASLVRFSIVLKLFCFFGGVVCSTNKFTFYYYYSAAIGRHTRYTHAMSETIHTRHDLYNRNERPFVRSLIARLNEWMRKTKKKRSTYRWTYRLVIRLNKNAQHTLKKRRRKTHKHNVCYILHLICCSSQRRCSCNSNQWQQFVRFGPFVYENGLRSFGRNVCDG